MRWIAVTIGLLLFLGGISRLEAQTFGLDPPKPLGMTTTTTPGGITFGAPARRITATESEEDRIPAVPPSVSSNSYLPAPVPRSNFGGGVQRPRMTLEEIQQRRAEEAWRRIEETQQRQAQIDFDRRMKDEVSNVFRVSRMDLFGEPNDRPATLRKAFAADRERVETGPPIARATAAMSNPPMSLNSAPPKTEAEIRREEQENREKTEEEERQERFEYVRKQREAAAQAFNERRAAAEKGAQFFEVPPDIQIPEQQLRAGRCRLFDGKTFFGWRTQQEGPYGGGHFSIDDEMIVSDPNRPGLLYTTNQFGDATFHLEYQAEEESEVFLLVRTSPNPRDLHSSCYTIVLNSADYQRPRGTILGRQMLSVDQIRKQEREAQAAMDADSIPPGQRWRKISAQFDGGVLRVTIDKDEAVTHFESKPPGCGYLGILVTKGTAKFRNMTWFPGSSISLFNVINPELDWQFREKAVQWAPTGDLSLKLTGGPGVVESFRVSDNFVLQFEYNIAHSFGRSALFFRSTPREDQTGYEVSLQNMPTLAERTSMVGVDVGAFRGIKNARFLRTDDQTWNYVTVLAVDRHFQTWVNGIPVCEWTVPIDQPLITSGTFQFLAPTDATNVQFRNIRVTPIEPRNERTRTFEDWNKTTYAEMTEQRRAAERERQLNEEMRKGGREQGTGSRE